MASGLATVKGFHAASSGPLNFRASVASSAEFAVDDYASYDEEKAAREGRSGEEGLEISKLGIAPEIVSALAKKSITKLFPIQVFSPFFFLLLTFDAFLDYVLCP